MEIFDSFFTKFDPIEIDRLEKVVGNYFVDLILWIESTNAK